MYAAHGETYRILPGADLNQASRVRQPRRRANDHRGVEPFAQIEGETRELEGLLGVRRFQTGDHGETAKQPGILLVLVGLSSARRP